MNVNQKSGSRSVYWSISLVALTTTLGVQVVRALFPLTVFNIHFDGLSIPSTTILAGFLAVVFVSPFFVPFLLRLLKLQRAIVGVGGGLAILRVILQVSPSIEANFFLAIFASVLALMALPLGFAWMRSLQSAGGYHFAIGIILGLAFDATLNTAFLTWDYIWQRDTFSLFIALILSGGVLVALWRLRATFAVIPREGSVRDMLPGHKSLPIGQWPCSRNVVPLRGERAVPSK